MNWTRDGSQWIDFTNDETNGGANYFVPGFNFMTIRLCGFMTIRPCGFEVAETLRQGFLCYLFELSRTRTNETWF